MNINISDDDLKRIQAIAGPRWNTIRDLLGIPKGEVVMPPPVIETAPMTTHVGESDGDE